jgi:hypothetical protein
VSPPACAQVFYHVTPDPTLACIRAGLAEIKEFKPDVIIALGGGSPMDAAKVMWLMYEVPETKFEGLSMRFMDIRKRWGPLPWGPCCFPGWATWHMPRLLPPHPSRMHAGQPTLSRVCPYQTIPARMLAAGCTTCPSWARRRRWCASPPRRAPAPRSRPSRSSLTRCAKHAVWGKRGGPRTACMASAEQQHCAEGGLLCRAVTHRPPVCSPPLRPQTTGQKYPLADYSLTPHMAIVDPQLVLGMPKALTAYGGIDALTHALESYVSVFATGGWPRQTTAPLH